MMKLEISYVNSWELYDANYFVHPSHRTAVIEVDDLLSLINEESNKGNMELPRPKGQMGFSASLFLSELRKILEEVLRK